jgi:hypothetical protein
MANTSKHRIPDIADTELRVVTTTLEERYGRAMEIPLADADFGTDPADRAPAACPVVARPSEDGRTIVIADTGARDYRCRFFRSPCKRMGTGTREHDGLAACMLALLQARADHVAQQRGELPTR